MHLLDHRHLHLAKLGATSGIDRFADRSLWTTLLTGEPAFIGPQWLRCRVLHRVRVGTATLIVAKATEASREHGEARDDAPGLAYVNRTWHRLDHGSAVD